MSDNAFRDAQDRLDELDEFHAKNEARTKSYAYGLNFRHLTEHTVRSLEMLLGCDGHPDEILGKVKELLKEHENARREAEGRMRNNESNA